MKFIAQRDQMDCGPACVAMISSIYGKNISLNYLKERSSLSKEGVSLLGISDLLTEIGFETYPARLDIKLFEEEGSFPCILHWNKNHFVVLIDHKKSIFSKEYKFKIADPGYGIIYLKKEEFIKSWISGEEKGTALFLSPTKDFNNKTFIKEKKINLISILKYLKPHKKQISILCILLFLGSIFTFIFPFLTQNLIDKGVNSKNINVIKLILFAQLGIFLGNIIIEIFRNYIVLKMGTQISITIISDFLNKILKLSISFFDSKMLGDFAQRIYDNERIEYFLSSEGLTTFFSIITFLVFFGVLWYYDLNILLIYLLFTIISILWLIFWLKKRKILDYIRFQNRSKNQENIYEIINGVTEIKLNKFEELKRKEWENHQNNLYKTNIRILKINQIQSSGFEFINQLKNIFVTYISITLVIKGSMSIGELLAISFIIGQLNSPVNQLISFFRSFQDTKLSLSRLNEVQSYSEEEQADLKSVNFTKKYFNNIPNGIELKNVSFQYEGSKSTFILKNVDFFIPEGKVTAIVGASGSGKTTLMKLLLKFYNPTKGSIFINGDNILSLSPKSIRENSGVVMQDGYIFSDTIERNITTGDEQIDKKRFENAIKIANIESFVDKLALGYKTKIGASGNGISGGQKQRILIARAVYKNPHYLFFDEATSALDADNEKIIHDNLQTFFIGKTVLIIAHRLSTVKKAEQIIVLKHGKIVEQGSHQELVMKRNEYFNLVKNQLELGD